MKSRVGDLSISTNRLTDTWLKHNQFTINFWQVCMCYIQQICLVSCLIPYGTIAFWEMDPEVNCSSSFHNAVILWMRVRSVCCMYTYFYRYEIAGQVQYCVQDLNEDENIEFIIYEASLVHASVVLIRSMSHKYGLLMLVVVHTWYVMQHWSLLALPNEIKFIVVAINTCHMHFGTFHQVWYHQLFCVVTQLVECWLASCVDLEPVVVLLESCCRK